MGIVRKVVITGLVAGVGMGIYKVVKGTQIADAAGKFDIKLLAFTLKETKKNGIGLPTSFVYTAKLNINNPTVNDVTLSQPYIKVSVADSSGNFTEVANTAIPDGSELTIKAKKATELSHDIEIASSDILSQVPNFINIIASKITGSPSSTRAKVDFTAEALGITISNSIPVNL